MPQARWFHRKLTKYIFFRKLLIGSFLSLLYVDTWKKWCILSLVALVVRPGWYLLAFASIHLCVFVHTQDLDSGCDDAEQFVILLYSMLTYVCVPVSACTILVYWSSCVMWAKKITNTAVFVCLRICICVFVVEDSGLVCIPPLWATICDKHVRICLSRATPCLLLHNWSELSNTYMFDQFILRGKQVCK